MPLRLGFAPLRETSSRAHFETQRHGRRKKLARTFVRGETGAWSLLVKPCPKMQRGCSEWSQPIIEP